MGSGRSCGGGCPAPGAFAFEPAALAFVAQSFALAFSSLSLGFSISRLETQVLSSASPQRGIRDKGCGSAGCLLLHLPGSWAGPGFSVRQCRARSRLPCEMRREDSVPGVTAALRAERLWIAYLTITLSCLCICSLWRGCWKIPLSKEVWSGIFRLSFVLTAVVTSSVPLAS